MSKREITDFGPDEPYTVKKPIPVIISDFLCPICGDTGEIIYTDPVYGPNCKKTCKCQLPLAPRFIV